MKKEILDKVRKNVPDFVFDSLYEDYVIDAIGKIREECVKDDDDKMNILKDLVGLIALKDIKIENVLETIKKELNLDEQTAKEISLIVLREILYPIKDYFPGIEDAIKSLGGEVPKIVPKKQVQKLVDEEKIEEKQKQTVREQIEAEAKRERVVKADIKTLLKEYTPAGEQEIGQNSIEVPSVALPVKPKIKYWIECYKEATGYGWNTNMERVKFIYHNKNTRGMNEEERRQLGLVLKSLDEGTPLTYLVKGKKIDFSNSLE